MAKELSSIHVFSSLVPLVCPQYPYPVQGAIMFLADHCDLIFGA